MITSFINTLILNSRKDMDKLIARFCKSHAQYGLQERHCESFAGAMVATVVSRLGRFSSETTKRVWEQVSSDLVKNMYRAYKRTNGGLNSPTRFKKKSLLTSNQNKPVAESKRSNGESTSPDASVL
mmetsp:Transcript_23630/g.46266  ORF Transcript_23630/g.46266 Transcript_23630/m.46266 type:complete len:126 (-) Transcript_23630:334-711(-)